EDLEKVIKSRKLPKSYFVLEQDNWDDHTVKATFYLKHISPSGKVDEIGSVKIIKYGQESGYTDFEEVTFKKLGLEYCSLGTSLTFYKNLINLFDTNEALKILESLKDCATDDAVYSIFASENSFQVSLLRTGEAEKALKEARALFSEDAMSSEENYSFRFNYKLEDNDNSKE